MKILFVSKMCNFENMLNYKAEEKSKGYSHYLFKIRINKYVERLMINIKLQFQ